MSDPLVSILMPVYNGGRYISDAIKSVLLQTYESWELLIVDDNSTDNTLSVIKEFKDARIRLYKNTKQLGLAENRNKALSLASGKYIAILDADDVSDKDRIRLQVAEFQKDKKLVLCGTWTKVIDELNRVTASWKFPTKSQALKAQMYLQFPFVHSSVMMRHEAIKKLKKLYQNEYSPAEDYDLCFRIMKLGYVQIIPKFLLKYRIHSKNTSSLYKSTLNTALPNLYQREFKKLGLTFSQESVNSFVLFLHPKTGLSVSIFDNLKIILQIEKQLKKQNDIQKKDLLKWWWYICKLFLLQVMNHFFGFTNQKQPQQ